MVRDHSSSPDVSMYNSKCADFLRAVERSSSSQNGNQFEPPFGAAPDDTVPELLLET